MPIHTDFEGLDTAAVQIPAADRAVPGRLAKPSARDAWSRMIAWIGRRLSS